MIERGKKHRNFIRGALPKEWGYVLREVGTELLSMNFWTLKMRQCRICQGAVRLSKEILVCDGRLTGGSHEVTPAF